MAEKLIIKLYSGRQLKDNEIITKSSVLFQEKISTILEDKKLVKPMKSSNEILVELFKVFNAAPPNELFDKTNLAEKSHKSKKRKHEKNSKKTKKNTEIYKSEDREKLLEREHFIKHKKKRKHKSKVKKNYKIFKNGEKDKSKCSTKDRVRDEMEDYNFHLKRYKSIERNNLQDKDRKEEILLEHKRTNDHKLKKTLLITPVEDIIPNLSKREHYLSKRHSNDHSAFLVDTKRLRHGEDYINKPNEDCVSTDGNISQISLSDEDCYLQERKHHIKKSKQNSNSEYICTYRRSGMRNNRYYRSYFESGASRSKNSQSCSPTRLHYHSLGIDKKGLLEIARKNAISMLKGGNLPGCGGISQAIKDNLLLKMRYGGRTVQDLTDFCKNISKGENLSNLGLDEESAIEKQDNANTFYHPFKINECKPIVMCTRSTTPIITRKTNDLTKNIAMQFPVSSGQEHRLTETWIPIKDKVPLAPIPPDIHLTKLLKLKHFKTSMSKDIQQKSTFTHVEAPINETCIDNAEHFVTNTYINDIVKELPSGTLLPSQTVRTLKLSPIPSVSTGATLPSFIPNKTATSISKESGILKDLRPQPDVSAIISKRLNAIRRLHENPKDSEAIEMMSNSQRDMSTWAVSKYTPGQFTGSTGVSVLTSHELNSGPQAWVRRDQLTSTKPFIGGMGMHMLKKMGWKPGEGLGREKTGSLHPLLLDIKLDKRGLMAKEDHSQKNAYQSKKQRVLNSVEQAQSNVADKHPVCLLNEITSRRKWTPPLYHLINEVGPPHNKMFLFSVTINGNAYIPNHASNTKKDAKLVAARYCLQEIGFLPQG